MSLYENHRFDEELPIIFHLDYRNKNNEAGYYSNWHENIEFLYCVEVMGKVMINSRAVDMLPGSLIVINSGDIHYTVSDTPQLVYYCLIVSSDFLQSFGMQVEGLRFTETVTASFGSEFFKKVIEEQNQKEAHYKTVIKGEIISFVARMCREYVEEKRTSGNDDMIKQGLQFIRGHFKENITVEQVATHAGFSKFHFSRQFKCITGKSVMDYVQFLRCRYARELLHEGKCSVSDAATECGFSDVSYFTKVFKRQMGVLPSEVMRGR